MKQFLGVQRYINLGDCDDGNFPAAVPTASATKPGVPTAPTNPPTHTAHKKKHAEGSEGHNLLETERTGFNKPSSTIPATKTSTEAFEPYSGRNQEYAQF